jgi:hypothetical protein
MFGKERREEQKQGASETYAKAELVRTSKTKHEEASHG